MTWILIAALVGDILAALVLTDVHLDVRRWWLRRSERRGGYIDLTRRP